MRGGGWRGCSNRIEAEVPGLGRDPSTSAPRTRPGRRRTAREAAVLIAPNWRSAPDGGVPLRRPRRLRRDGALAIRVTPRGLEVAGARSLNRGRPWTRDP